MDGEGYEVIFQISTSSGAQGKACKISPRQVTEDLGGLQLTEELAAQQIGNYFPKDLFLAKQIPEEGPLSSYETS